jgi:hypothetical protein
MKAQVTKEFKGLADLNTTERYFAVGEFIYGDLAVSAVAAGNAEEVGAEKKPAKAKAKK